MYLKKLELSGFKSFARTTVLDFPSKITGVVGPNGAGKSNLKDAIQWVLGEQSIKSLRGKRGEDLIWSGSPVSPAGGPQIPRVGKASVTLVFDNKDGKIPLEFEEVSLGRKIFRDGLNEYFINDSQVRLKDVVELMARIGLGETKHNIISQGEVDRLLMASFRDRREMLEEALGLRVYQLKKEEAERKLSATENNMNQVETLLKEIAPHLKFLRAQAVKAEARETVQGELRLLELIYLVKETKAVQEERENLTMCMEPLKKKREETKKEVDKILTQIAEKEKIFSAPSEDPEEKKIIEYETKRRDLERELGRLEGKLEVEKKEFEKPQVRPVDVGYLKTRIEVIAAEVREILEEEESSEVIKSRFWALLEDLEQLIKKLERGVVEEGERGGSSEKIREFERAMRQIQEKLHTIGSGVKIFEEVRRKKYTNYRESQQELRVFEGMLREKQDEERDLMIELQRVSFEDERLKIREEELIRGRKESGISSEELSSASLDGYQVTPIEELKRKIERFRIKLEEIGGIDPAAVKEFQDTETRHSFLAHELKDLQEASRSLRELSKELEGHIAREFRDGFGKIKSEFHHYFRIIFGGGRASLQLVDFDVHPENQLEDDKFAEREFGVRRESGIEISVDLPRKRIKGLAMLSGGERALTSIALLFAITAVNPPPFLVLDETDAALDEANSRRYAEILKELSKKTQLLLVTHNRETMKAAGVLYGVTMGDEGASKLLSLKLEEAEGYTNR